MFEWVGLLQACVFIQGGKGTNLSGQDCCGLVTFSRAILGSSPLWEILLLYSINISLSLFTRLETTQYICPVISIMSFFYAKALWLIKQLILVSLYHWFCWSFWCIVICNLRYHTIRSFQVIHYFTRYSGIAKEVNLL